MWKEFIVRFISIYFYAHDDTSFFSSNMATGKGVIENFFSEGQLKSDETTEDPMEFEKQMWLAETGQWRRRTSANREKF